MPTTTHNRQPQPRTNPHCTATQHGTPNAYNHHGCRCDEARQSHLRYRKRLRAGHQPTAMVPSIGAQRRLLALNAIGHTSRELSRHIGIHDRNIREHMRGSRTTIHRDIDQRIRHTYRKLAGIPGPSAQCRELAKAKGTPTPVAWGDDIDDPNAQPDMTTPDNDPTGYDWYATELVLSRTRPLSSLTALADRQHVVRVLHDERHMDVEAIAHHVNTNSTVVTNILNSLNPATRKRCETCGDPLQTLQASARFCRPCGRQRLKEQKVSSARRTTHPADTRELVAA